MKKILVCGAAGFMGTNIALDLAKKGYEVYTVTHKTPLEKIVLENTTNNYIVDLTDRDQVNNLFAKEFDIVVQAAAYTTGAEDIVNRPYVHVTDNVIMNALILRACYDYKVEHFFFLTCGVMYKSMDTPQIEEDFDESAEMHPPYFGVGWMKVYVEKQSEFFSRLGITKHTMIKHANTYGTYDKFDLQKGHVLAASVRKVLEAENEIEAWGDGSEARDLIYVQDVCDFISLAIEKQKTPYELFHVAAGSAITIKELIEKIIKISGKDITIKWNPGKPTVKFTLALDCSKAEKFGWKRKIDLNEGLKRTIEFYKQHYKNINEKNNT